MSERPNVPSGTDPLLVVAVDRPALDTFATCACYQLQLGSHNLSPWRIFGGHADFGEFSASGEASVWPCGVHYRWRKLDRARVRLRRRQAAPTEIPSELLGRAYSVLEDRLVDVRPAYHIGVGG